MNKTINVGLIGFGMAGQVFHAPIITSVDGLCLHTVCVRRPEHQDALRARYPQAKAVMHADEVFADEDVDLVIVATSNDVHYRLAKAALQAGKHVVVEKPFTNNAFDADELIALAEAQNCLLSVHHNARWNSDYLTVKKIIESGRLGQLIAFEARYDRFRPALRKNAWREQNSPGAGILYDLGAHLIDQSLQLFGFPEAVHADLRQQRPGAKTVDDFHLILHYPKIRITLRGSMLVKEPSPRYALYGLNGAFVKYGIDPQEAALKRGESPRENKGWGLEPKAIWGKLNVLDGENDDVSFIESERGDYPAFYRNVRDAMRGMEALLVKPEEARNVIRLIELAEKSWNEKRTVMLTNELR